MLVLSRKPDEGVRIGDNIEVVVLEVKNGKVRLGFRCPDDVTILRNEVYERGQAEVAITEPSAADHCMAG